jgi:hypothetical protein
MCESFLLRREGRAIRSPAGSDPVDYARGTWRCADLCVTNADGEKPRRPARQIGVIAASMQSEHGRISRRCCARRPCTSTCFWSAASSACENSATCAARARPATSGLSNLALPDVLATFAASQQARLNFRQVLFDPSARFSLLPETGADAEGSRFALWPLWRQGIAQHGRRRRRRVRQVRAPVADSCHKLCRLGAAGGIGDLPAPVVRLSGPPLPPPRLHLALHLPAPRPAHLYAPPFPSLPFPPLARARSPFFPLPQAAPCACRSSCRRRGGQQAQPLGRPRGACDGGSCAPGACYAPCWHCRNRG